MLPKPNNPLALERNTFARRVRLLRKLALPSWNSDNADGVPKLWFVACKREISPEIGTYADLLARVVAYRKFLQGRNCKTACKRAEAVGVGENLTLGLVRVSMNFANLAMLAVHFFISCISFRNTCRDRPSLDSAKEHFRISRIFLKWTSCLGCPGASERAFQYRFP